MFFRDILAYGTISILSFLFITIPPSRHTPCHLPLHKWGVGLVKIFIDYLSIFQICNYGRCPRQLQKTCFLLTRIIVFESFWGNFFKKRPKQGLGQGLDFYFWFPKITEKRVVIKRLLPLSNPLWPEPRVSGVVCTLLTAPLCKGSCQRSWLRDWFCIFTEIDYCIGLVLTILHSMQKIRSRSRLMGCFVVS